MAGGFSGPPRVPRGTFLARLRTDGGISSILTLLPFNGNQIEINRKLLTVPTLGLTRNVADHLIDGAGADAGVAPSVSTLYFVYVSNANATFSPSSIRLSATAWTTVNGVRYLGNVGNALNWRFVGWAKTDATPQFVSNETSRRIINWYNKLRLPLLANPGYVDDNAPTIYQVSSTTYVELNGGVGARVDFISNGVDAIDFSGIFCAQAGPGFSALFGLGIDTVAGPESFCLVGATGTIVNETATTRYCDILSEAAHFVALLGLTNSGSAAANIFADFERDGAASDPRGTLVRGTVMG